MDSIPASSDTAESEGRQIKQWWIKYIQKNFKKLPLFTNKRELASWTYKVVSLCCAPSKAKQQIHRYCFDALIAAAVLPFFASVPAPSVGAVMLLSSLLFSSCLCSCQPCCCCLCWQCAVGTLHGLLLLASLLLLISVADFLTVSGISGINTTVVSAGAVVPVLLASLL